MHVGYSTWRIGRKSRIDWRRCISVEIRPGPRRHEDDRADHVDLDRDAAELCAVDVEREGVGLAEVRRDDVVVDRRLNASSADEITPAGSGGVTFQR